MIAERSIVGAIANAAKRLALPIVVLAAVLSAQVYLSRIFGSYAPRIEFNAQNYGLSYEQSITAEAIESLNAAYLPSFRKITQGNISADETVANSNERVINSSIVITNGNYNRYKDFAVTRGSFFTRNAVEMGLNLVVISEDLSFNLFRTVNSVGNEVTINGLPYEVVGVYKTNGLADLISSDGSERVYIPANSDFDVYQARNLAVQSVIITASANLPPSLTEQDAMSALAGISSNMGSYIAKDFSMSGAIINQFVQIELFLMFIVAVVFVVKLFLRDVKRGYESYAQEEQSTRKGLASYLSDKSVTLLLYVMKWVIITFACLFAYRFVAFDLFVPSKYISSARLLDFEFYMNIIVTAIRNANAYYAYNAQSYEELYHFVLTAESACFAMFIAALTSLIRRVRKLIDRNE